MKSLQNKRIENVRRRPCYLTKTYFQIKLINQEGVIIAQILMEKPPWEVFAANAHLGAPCLFYLVLFISCICSFIFFGYTLPI